MSKSGYRRRIVILKSKIEVPMDVRYSKSGDMANSGQNDLTIRTNASSEMGQDQAFEGESGLCWLAAPVAKRSRETSLNFVIRSKSVIRSSSVTRSRFSGV